MSSIILIDQHNLYDIAVIEYKRIAVYAVDEWIHDDVFGSRHGRVQSWYFLCHVGDVIDDSSVDLLVLHSSASH